MTSLLVDIYSKSENSNPLIINKNKLKASKSNYKLSLDMNVKNRWRLETKRCKAFEILQFVDDQCLIFLIDEYIWKRESFIYLLYKKWN